MESPHKRRQAESDDHPRLHKLSGDEFKWSQPYVPFGLRNAEAAAETVAATAALGEMAVCATVENE